MDWQWDQTENKTTVGIYAGGALVALWLSSSIVGAINSVPLLPKIMELIGLGYTGWFVYRYLLFKSSRKELVQDIEELKGKITGAAREEGLWAYSAICQYFDCPVALNCVNYVTEMLNEVQRFQWTTICEFYVRVLARSTDQLE